MRSGVNTIVVDTNVFIDAFFHADDFSKRIVQLILGREIKLAVSIPIIDELTLIFTEQLYKLQATQEQMHKFNRTLGRILGRAECYDPQKCFDVCLDKEDNKFFDCAYVANACCIISQDTHCFTGKEFKNKDGQTVNVYSPQQYYVKHKAESKALHISSRKK